MKNKVPTLQLPKAHTLRMMANRAPTEVAQQTRRLTGVTPKIIGSYGSSPARYLKRSRELAGVKRRKVAGLKSMMQGGV